MIKNGNNDIATIYLGGNKISKVCVGNQEIWSENPEITNYVTFTSAISNSSIGLEKLSTNQQLWYSVDRNNWENMTTATTITLANSGDTAYIRGILSADNTDSDYTQFKMTGKISASGNCNCLWNYENPNIQLKQYCGYKMFMGCTSLTTAPELPATTLTIGCYSGMFYDCTSLTTAPVLPATTLTDGCYVYMFYSCSNLNYIKCLAIDISADICTANWVIDVSNSGTFVKNHNMTGWTTGANGIPSGWTIQNV